VNHGVLQHLHPEHVEVEIGRADALEVHHGLSSELDEMWSYVHSKANPRWLWHAIDHSTGAAQLPTQALALMQDRLVAEAHTAAWQDYFLLNALLATLCLFPALPCWRREKYGDPATPQAAAAPVQHAATSNNPSISETSGRNHATRTPPAGLRSGGQALVDTPAQEP
jgi:hypothetical protein